MSLETGTRFGAYEVVERIGAGGMGEVWRATDTALKRDVAIKILPQAFADDADRLARFRREAEILAALNHPNIATIHGLEKLDEQIVIVMELVDGPTLEDRIRQGPIPPDEAMGIALQIVAALEAAHDRQIVHRDLKPANVKLRADGTVKVLDFGISKPIDASAISGGAAVATTPAVTQTGVILGTAAYMSPEQAQGKFVDQRSDIWAFGCLLFEMLTGQPAFGGENVMAILARVIDRESDLSSIPGTIGPAVRHTIKLCLEKDPRRRIADIRDARLALEGRFDSMPAAAAPVSAAGASRGTRLGLPLAALAAGVVLTAATAFLLWPQAEPKPVTRFTIPIPEGLNFRRLVTRLFALSPDGRRLVFHLTDGFYLRDLESLEATRLPNTSGEDLLAPSFSADGLGVEYVKELDENVLRLERLSISGGPATQVFDSVEALQSGVTNGTSFSRMVDGTYLVSAQGGVFRVDPAEGRAYNRVIDIADNLLVSGARVLPDQDTVLFATHGRPAGQGDLVSTIVAASLSGGTGEIEPIEILPRATDPRYLPASGHLLFVRDAVVYAVPFDTDSLSVRGQPQAVLPNVRLATLGLEGDFDVAANGTLAYVYNPSDDGVEIGATLALNPELGWIYEDGRFDPLSFPRSGRPGHLRFPMLSPDNTRLAAAVSVDGAWDIYVHDLSRPGTRTLIAGADAAETGSVWTPDGQSVIFFREGAGIFRRAADASGPEERLLPLPDEFVRTIPTSVNPDGTELIFTGIEALGANGEFGIYRLTLSGDAGWETVLDEPGFRESSARLSPDGRYMAYTTTETGTTEVHIRPYPDVTSRRIVVSTSGGYDPQWDANGGFLYYLEGIGNDVTLVRVAVPTEPTAEIGDPEAVAEGIVGTNVNPNYAYDSDADRWLVYLSPLRSSGENLDNSIVVVENWVEWLKEAVPVE